MSFFFLASPLAAQPVWVNTPHAGHNPQKYIIAVGSGNSRISAERDALRGIAALFGISIHAVEEITTLYRELASDAASAWTYQTDYRSVIETSLAMGNLMGATVQERWDDGRGTHFVLAVLNRENAVRLYSERIQANQDIIRNLTNMSAAQRNTFDGFARYRFAAPFADMSITYAEMLVVLGAPWRGSLRSGEYFLQRSREILMEIPIGINVRNDRMGRIQSAFASAFTANSFRTGGVNPRFTLDVTVNIRREGHTIPGLEGAWIEINANLTDTHTRTVLLPYAFNLRGMPRQTMQEAENIVFNAAVQRISDEYGNLLSEYLARLIPGR